MIEDICPFEHYENVFPCIVCNAIALTRTKERQRIYNAIKNFDLDKGHVNAVGMKKQALKIIFGSDDLTKNNNIFKNNDSDGV